jgi:hypothetical protein
VLNSHRSTGKSGIRQDWIALYNKGEGNAPSAEQLLHIVQRKGLEVDPKDPLINAQNRAWLSWHADKLLPKAAGTNLWSGSIRHCQTILGAQLPVSCEAFVILCMEND